jgi:hypothetical protein
MIAKIFITDPEHRITISQIRAHSWYQLHQPETKNFYVCPPHLQTEKSSIICKNGTKFVVSQRPNLLNQKVLGILEEKHKFNRESLLKSIKNNKHNHLTATYYLLLKKHMIRHLRPYSDAFMELKEYSPDQDIEMARPPSH